MSPSYHGGPAWPSDFPSRTRSKLFKAPPRSFSNFVKQSGIITSCQTLRLGDQKPSLIATAWMGTAVSWLEDWATALQRLPSRLQSVPTIMAMEKNFINRHKGLRTAKSAARLQSNKKITRARRVQYLSANLSYTINPEIE